MLISGHSACVVRLRRWIYQGVERGTHHEIWWAGSTVFSVHARGGNQRDGLGMGWGFFGSLGNLPLLNAVSPQPLKYVCVSIGCMVGTTFPF